MEPASFSPALENSPTNIPDDRIASAPVEVLKQWRLQTLRNVDRTGETLARLRHEIAMYTRAAEELEVRLREAEARAAQSDRDGAEEASGDARREVERLRTLAEKNHQIADAKREEMLGKEREIYELQSLADRLTEKIRKRAADY